jgi:hypothetical protein
MFCGASMERSRRQYPQTPQTRRRGSCVSPKILRFAFSTPHEELSEPGTLAHASRCRQPPHQYLPCTPVVSETPSESVAAEVGNIRTMWPPAIGAVSSSIRMRAYVCTEDPVDRAIVALHLHLAPGPCGLRDRVGCCAIWSPAAEKTECNKILRR